MLEHTLKKWRKNTLKIVKKSKVLAHESANSLKTGQNQSFWIFLRSRGPQNISPSLQDGFFKDFGVPTGAQNEMLVFTFCFFFFRGFCMLCSRPSPDGSRAPFWTHLGKSRNDFGMDFGMNFVTFVGNFERKSCTDRAQNPADGLGYPTRMHKL